jgi:hypothetical protein
MRASANYHGDINDTQKDDRDKQSPKDGCSVTYGLILLSYYIIMQVFIEINIVNRLNNYPI